MIEFMRTALKNLSLLIALVAIVYLIANYSEPVKNQVLSLLNLSTSSVKGASTERAQEITEKFQSDIGTQLGVLQEEALNFTLGDAITVVSRLQKIPEDFHSIQEYTSQRIENFTQKK